jgi:MFS family permease
VTAAAPQLAGRREWIGLAVFALACLLYAMDLTVLHLAVPSLSADLHPSSSELLWITDTVALSAVAAACLACPGKRLPAEAEG